MRAGDTSLAGALHRRTFIGSLNASLNHRTFGVWCQGQDSNLRSPSGQRFYRPSVLATHPPWLCALSSLPVSSLALSCRPSRFTRCPLLRVEPEGGFEPSTYRLQIGCAAIAPLGPGFCLLGPNFRVSRPQRSAGFSPTKIGPRLRGSNQSI